MSAYNQNFLLKAIFSLLEASLADWGRMSETFDAVMDVLVLLGKTSGTKTVMDVLVLLGRTSGTVTVTVESPFINWRLMGLFSVFLFFFDFLFFL